VTQTYEAPGTALSVPQDAPIVPQAGIMPVVSPDEARAQMRAYQELCAAILTDDDYQEFTETKWINGEKVQTKKRFKKKSAVKKLQTYFGISVEVIDEATHRDELGDEHFGFRTKARATSPGGRSVEALAGCSTHEERFELTPFARESDVDFAKRQRKALARSYHDVLSTAETRATNRAVMNLVSPGEVTAEEISRPNRSSEKRPAPSPAAAPSRPAEAPSEPGITVAELVDLARSVGVLDFRAWCAHFIDPGFSDPKRGMRPAEKARAKDLLEALALPEDDEPLAPGAVTEAAANAEADARKRRALRTSIVVNARVLWPGKKNDEERHRAERLHRVHGLTDDVIDQVPMEALESLERDLARRAAGRTEEADVDDALLEYAEGKLL
jgi:hypothetical protein